MRKKLVLLTAIAVMLCSSASAREFRVAVAPFDARPGEDISFLQSALQTLLSSRISDPRKIMVIDHARVIKELPAGEKSTLQEKILAAKKARADFLLTGSIIKQGSTLSIDALLITIDRGSRQSPVRVQNILIDNLIPEIAVFAQKIRDLIAELPQPPDTPGQKAQQPQQQQKRAVKDEIPEDMPYPPMPEKKSSDRFKIQEKEESRVKETEIDDTAE